MKAKLSIGTWAYLFNQEKPTNDFHTILHKLQDLGYEGVELGSFGPHPSPATHPTKASRQKLRKEIADHGLSVGVALRLLAGEVEQRSAVRSSHAINSRANAPAADPRPASGTTPAMYP